MNKAYSSQSPDFSIIHSSGRGGTQKSIFGEMSSSFFFFFLSFSLGLHPWHMEIPRFGVYSCWPKPQSQQLGIQATSEAYTTAHGNPGSLTHSARPGIELASSWFLVRFVSAVPEWELLGKYFKVCFSKLGICFIIPLEYMQNFD